MRALCESVVCISGRAAGIFLGVALGVAAPAFAPPVGLARPDGEDAAEGQAAPTPEALVDEAWRTVRDHCFDPTFGGTDWNAVRARFLPLAARARDLPQAHALIRDMLRELHASHVGLIDGEIYHSHVLSELAGRTSTSFGFGLLRLEDGFFVTDVLDGGPAARAGLRRGDRLALVDGVPTAESPLLVDAGNDVGSDGPLAFSLRCRPDARLRLGVDRSPVPEERTEIVLDAGEWSEVLATEASIRIHEPEPGVRVGSIHLWHLLSPRIADILRAALEADLAGCDALVLDIRGKGGRPAIVTRVLSFLQRRGDEEPLFRGPVAALIDRRTRSAKEVLAWHLRTRHLATLVGERTEGAVIGAQFFPLADGSYLMVAATDVRRLTDGTVLEGVGVEPDVPVEDTLAWSAGRDPILEEALALVARHVVRRRTAAAHAPSPR